MTDADRAERFLQRRWPSGVSCRRPTSGARDRAAASRALQELLAEVRRDASRRCARIAEALGAGDVAAEFVGRDDESCRRAGPGRV